MDSDYHAIKSERTTLDFLGGVNYTHETYSNGTLIDPGPPPTVRLLWSDEPVRRTDSG